MHRAERDVLLFLLASGSGAADAWSYMGLGHTFVANMTGNTVLLGLAVFARKGEFLYPLTSLVCYAAGAAVSTFVARKVAPDAIWTRPISWMLLVESLILAGAEIAWAAIHARPISPSLTGPVLGAAAFAIGLQSGAMLQLRIPGIVTTYITGTWTTLVSGVVKLCADTQARKPRQRLEFEERIILQAGVLVVYFLSALLSGWLFYHQPACVGALAVASVFPAALYGLMRA